MSGFAPELNSPARASQQRPADLDISLDLMIDLALRRVQLDDTSSISRLSQVLGLPVRTVDQVFAELRTRKWVEVQGLVGHDYTFTLTAQGREQAVERSSRTRYAQIAPVSLDSYARTVANQRAHPRVRRADIQQAYSDMVLTDDLIEQLGPAFTSQGSMFIYGPSGTGKTSLGERLTRLYRDGVLVPHAVEVDGHIITVFDPLVHRPLDPQPTDIDPRWVACYRPLVSVGGELDLDMLQLRFDSTSGTYSAPLQMRANNGILFIDDFGRQLVSPQALLNRWIVPLDRRIDYLTLQHGQKFVIPFELMVVFSTNLDPADLSEDAFFRRIQNKVYVGPITDEQFDWIMIRSVRRHGVRATNSSAGHLRAVCRANGSGDLLACYPDDFCRLAIAICAYEDREPALDEEIIDRAAHLYFAAAVGLGKRQRSNRAPAGDEGDQPR